jgi:hypothetical protein
LILETKPHPGGTVRCAHCDRKIPAPTTRADGPAKLVLYLPKRRGWGSDRLLCGTRCAAKEVSKLDTKTPMNSRGLEEKVA